MKSSAIQNQLDSPKSLPLAPMLAILLAITGMTFFFGLGSLPLLGPDEPRYAEIAREMFVSNDFISPRLNGRLWFEKPILLYWMQAASYSVFGVNEFAARFPSALCAAIVVLFLGIWLSRLISSRLGLVTACVLATSVSFIAFSRAAATDMPLAAALAVAIPCGYMALTYNRCDDYRARRWWIGCAAATGIGMLAKGLVAILLVALILGLFAIATRPHRVANEMGRTSGAEKVRQGTVAGVVFLLVIATWYLPVTLRHGWDFIEEFFINHHFKRYLTNEFRHPQPILFFPVVALIGALPWTGFLFPALARLRFLRPRNEERDALALLGWIWFGVTVLFFSLSTSKLPGYILPCFPALAILLAIEIESAWNGDHARRFQIATLVTACLLVILGIGATLYLYRKTEIKHDLPLSLMLLPVLFGLATAATMIVKRGRMILASPIAMTLGVVLTAIILLVPHIYDSLSFKPLSVAVAQSLRVGERVTFYREPRQYAPVFYTQGRVLPGEGKSDILNVEKLRDMKAILNQQRTGSLIVITTTPGERELKSDRSFLIEPIVRQKDLSAWRLSLPE